MPERRAPDDPVEWLNRARSNLTRAREDARLDGVYLEDLCFDAQQAAEKAIKAVLIRRGIEFPYVHDLGRLFTLLEENGLEVPQNVRAAETLTPYAAIARYPTLFEPVTREQYLRAVELAEAVLEWAAHHVKENKE